MKKLQTWLALLAALSLAACSRSGVEQVKSRARELNDEAKNHLEAANRKLKEGLQRADEDTRRGLDKARVKIREAMLRTQQDLEKIRNDVRDSKPERQD